MGEPRSAQEAVDAIATLAAAEQRWTVLIDGRAGAGKSTLARLLADRTGATLVRLDDCYPGWDGLAAGAECVRRSLLEPRAAGRPAGWRRWDWFADTWAEWHAVDPDRGLIVEGCGALTRSSTPLASLTLWVELDDRTRHARAIARDGDLFAAHWTRWADQEEAAIRAESPRQRADLLVDGRTIRASFSSAPLPSPAMSDISTEPGQYVAEYLDGPMEGTTEHRFLQDGEPEASITQYALVDGTDAMFEYTAGERRELNGEQFVQYAFDAGDSDPLQGQADPDQESKAL